MMKRTFSLVLLSVLTASGCSYFSNNSLYGEEGLIRDRSQAYQQAEEDKALVFPKQLKVKKLTSNMVIPDAKDVPQAHAFSQRPLFFYADLHTDTIQLERSSGQILFTVKADPKEVRELLIKFWENKNIKMATTKDGLQTEWFKPYQGAKDDGLLQLWFGSDDKKASKDKLDFQLKTIARGVLVSVQVARYPAKEEIENIQWQKRPLAYYKAAIAPELTHYFVKHFSTNKVTSLSSLDKKGKKERLSEYGHNALGQPMLQINSDFSKAWRLVLKTLPKLDLTVSETIKSKGIIRLTTDAEELNQFVLKTSHQGVLLQLQIDREDDVSASYQEQESRLWALHQLLLKS